MFRKFISLFAQQTNVVTEQQKLDTLRYHNAGNQLMQLHCDRMQSAMSVSR